MLPLPVSFDFTLPKWTNVPQTTAIAAGVGYVYGKVTDSPALLCAKIFALTQFANSIFYLILERACIGPRVFRHPKDRLIDLIQRRFLSAGTTLVTQTIGILAMRHFNLIAKQGTLVWSGLTLSLCLVHIYQGMREGDGKPKNTIDLRKIL